MAKSAGAKAVHAAALAGEKVTLDWMEKPDDDPAAQAQATPDPVAALTAQIAELKGQIAGMGRQAAPSPVAGYEPMPNVQTEIDYNKLPDVNEDPKGYAKALNEQMLAVQQGKAAITQWEQRQNAATTKAADKLFKDFTKAYPDYAKNRKAVEVFAEECAEDAQAARKDVAAYMFGNTSEFFKDVVAKMDEAGFGKKADAEPDEDEPDNRAMGIPGERAGGKAKADADIPAAKSMIGSLSSWQQKTGFHP